MKILLILILLTKTATWANEENIVKKEWSSCKVDSDCKIICSFCREVNVNTEWVKSNKASDEGFCLKSSCGFSKIFGYVPFCHKNRCSSKKKAN